MTIKITEIREAMDIDNVVMRGLIPQGPDAASADVRRHMIIGARKDIFDAANKTDIHSIPSSLVSKYSQLHDLMIEIEVQEGMLGAGK